MLGGGGGVGVVVVVGFMKAYAMPHLGARPHVVSPILGHLMKVGNGVLICVCRCQQPVTMRSEAKEILEDFDSDP